jgi:Skp family chaperone for outer membrane proteins
MTFFYIVAFLLVIGTLACFTIVIHINKSYENFQKICEHELKKMTDEIHHIKLHKNDIQDELKRYRKEYQKITKLFVLTDENNTESTTKNP